MECQRMASSGEDSEVACYVLAYLLRENYSETANAFLKECRVLPTGTLLVLPQTSLKSVVAEHKSRHDSLVLLNTLGSGSAYQALCTKLDKTLQQMKCLYEQLLSSQASAPLHRAATAFRTKNTRAKQTKPLAASVSMATGSLRRPSTGTTFATPATAPQKLSTAHADPKAPVHLQLASPEKSQPSLTPHSPHRRKPVPKRKPQSSHEVKGMGPSASPSSPTMHQIVETFLEDDYLPGKLADIINKCVDSDSELSSTTLDSILNMTQLEPAFEGLLPGPTAALPTSQQMSTSPPTADHTQAPVPPTTDHIRAPVPATTYVPVLATSSSHTSATAALNTMVEDPVGVDHQEEDFPARKRLRLSSEDGETGFPTDEDIDDFLDQLHQ